MAMSPTAAARPWRSLALGLAASVALAAGAQANLLTNGGFEAPIVAANNFQTVNPGGEPSGFGWTVPTGSVDVVANLIFNPSTGAAFEGVQFLDLVGTNTGSTGSIRQSFATAVGQSYTLSFVYGNNPQTGSTASALVTVTDTVSGTLLSNTITHTTSTFNNFDWTAYSASFTATATTTTLTFTNTVGQNQGGIFLDAVNVDRSTTPPVTTPEPATLALLGIGLAGLGAARRRRR